MISNELLKKKILDKAIHGRLVKNDCNLKKSEVKENTEIALFDIPANWLWTELNNVCQLSNGEKVKDVNLPYLDVKYLRTRGEKGFKNSGTILNSGDYIILVDGENSGEVFIAPEKGIMGSTFKKLLFNNKINNKYIRLLLKYYQEILKNNKTGSAIPHLNKKMFSWLPVPIPPLEEQEKIVKKIDVLFELIDKKEKNDNEKEKLKTLLKEKILDNAIHGKLIENDLSLPAVEVEEVKDNIPFEIPNNWRWCYYENIGYSGIGLTYKPDNITNNGMIVLRSSNIQNGKLDLKDIVRVDCKVNDNIIVNENDILICARNGSKRLIGKSCLLNNLSEKMTYGAFMTIFRTPYYKYVYWFMQSKYYYNQLYENTNTMTINQITQKKLKSLLLPIPPLEQQKRIVEKIEKCFELIEQL